MLEETTCDMWAPFPVVAYLQEMMSKQANTQHAVRSFKLHGRNMKSTAKEIRIFER